MLVRDLFHATLNDEKMTRQIFFWRDLGRQKKACALRFNLEIFKKRTHAKVCKLESQTT